jgi:phosphatidylglycerol:prolipoprotein diacylglycerol transferase
MYPHQVSLPLVGWQIDLPDTVVNLAVVCAVLFGARLLTRHAGLSPRRALVVMALLGLAGLLGGRLHFVVNQAFTSDWSRAVVFWRGGLHMPGAMLGVFLTAPLICRLFGVPVGRFGDAVTPAVAAGIVMTRFGCVLRGCCVGEPCAAPWCIAYPSGSVAHYWHATQSLIPPDAPWSLPVLPLHLGFIAIGLLIAVGAWVLRPWKRYDGQVALVALVVYATTSAALEPFRMQVAGIGVWGSLPQLVWATRALSAFAVTLLVAVELAQWYRRRWPAPSRVAA